VIVALRFLFTVVLLSMLWVTTWASVQCPLFAVPRGVATHPWFIATMFDAYWGFTTFFVWVCFKQATWTARIAWFLAIMALGNIAMSSYWLSELYMVRTDGKVADLLVARRSGPGLLGIALALVGVAVTVAAAFVSTPAK
jgi:Protein of unknown function (DUF1475)